jgi:cysteine-rich repeat protein
MDLAGNVWEWGLDWYAPYRVPCDNCADVTTDYHRELRGGSFLNNAAGLYSAGRDYINDTPASAHPDIGARCARPSIPTCGDGTVDSGETCDDGNLRSGDGCSATCATEDGFACSGTPSACNRSCNGLAKTCGPNGDDDCCASNAVPGGTFYRSYDGVNFKNQDSPATVSDFRLDKYEITVGRFRQFVAAYTQDLIAQGAGRNPSNPDDTGWDTAWNASLDTDATTLTTALKCDPTQQTWGDSPGSTAAEQLPINCLSWFEAEAFCIWDGGRLPTEAEWNYTASGGTEQRVYPWGNADADSSYAVFNVNSAAIVGSKSPKGDGKWGQADLAGNVWEWTQDFDPGGYLNPCDNCADLTSVASASKVLRGGMFTGDSGYMYSSIRSAGSWSRGPSTDYFSVGARCARAR